MDPRGFPTSLPEFQAVFPTVEACAAYLESIRWPEGFICHKCGTHGIPYRFPSRSSVVLRCRICKANTSLTAGTVMQSSHTPLTTWFWGAYLVTTQTPGQSAVQFQRQLGLSRYETAFQILHKLRAGMVRPERDCIGGEHPVEVDECFIGGRTRGEGRGVHHMTTVIGAVEVRLREETKKRHKRCVYAGRLRLRVIPNRSSSAIMGFVESSIAQSSTIRTDAWIGYDPMTSLGFHHERLILNGDAKKTDAHLPMIHLIFSNLKTWIMGTHHGAIAQHHLQAYLNEFVFRFNRRFYPMTAFNSVLGLAAKSVSPTYEALYSGQWHHPV
jgi:hypothetical protein